MSERYLVRYGVTWNNHNGGAGERFIRAVWPDDSDDVMDILVEFRLDKPVRAAKIALFESRNWAPASPQNVALRPIEWVPVDCQPEDFISQEKETSDA